MEPSGSAATLLLCAIMSDTVILNSPTTTERDRAAVEYLGRVLALDPLALGREMFEATSDLDEGTEARVLDGLASFLAGRTTLFVTHRWSVAARADRVVELPLPTEA